jgi:hypothetical protein
MCGRCRSPGPSPGQRRPRRAATVAIVGNGDGPKGASTPVRRAPLMVVGSEGGKRSLFQKILLLIVVRRVQHPVVVGQFDGRPAKVNAISLTS